MSAGACCLSAYLITRHLISYQRVYQRVSADASFQTRAPPFAFFIVIATSFISFRFTPHGIAQPFTHHSLICFLCRSLLLAVALASASLFLNNKPPPSPPRIKSLLTSALRSLPPSNDRSRNFRVEPHTCIRMPTFRADSVIRRVESRPRPSTAMTRS